MPRIGPASGLLACVCALVMPGPSAAQSRGVYPLGMTAIASGITPEPGFSYANQVLLYSRDELKAADGRPVPVSGRNAVIMDMNSFVWVSGWTLLGGARYSVVVTLPIARNQLISDIRGPLSGGSGFADSYCLPLVLGWNKERVSIRALAGVLVPTGRFAEGANDNVGSGYWTPTLSSGQTVPITRSRALTFSAFELYEWHTTQRGTGTKPGGTFNLDYSLLRTFAFAKGPTQLQVGVAGYVQRQATARTGPAVTEEESRERYAVNAIGFAGNLVLPNHWVNVGVRLFEEFANRAAFQGYSFQASGSVSF